MGKRLDALLGRSFRTSKFKALLNLAISRLSILKNQRKVRCSHARSDVVQLLHLGQHQRALLRVEHVIKEQNMLDAFDMMEGYCLLLVERICLMEQERVCPDELKEGISSLMYASSRCGEFPELQQIRAVFVSRFGKEFVDRAIELRNNSGVNPLMVQKLSTRQASLEERMTVLKQIASENSIVLQLEEAPSVSTTERTEMSREPNQPKAKLSADSSGAESNDDLKLLPEDIAGDGQFSASMKSRKYKDVADAAQAAFVSAAYAAAAARAAVELSQSNHQPDDQDSLSPRQRKISGGSNFTESMHEITGNINVISGSEKIHSIDNSDSDLEEDKSNCDSEAQDFEGMKNIAELKRSSSNSSSDSGDVLRSGSMSPDMLIQSNQTEENVFGKMDGESREKAYSLHGQIPQRSRVYSKAISGPRDPLPGPIKGSRMESARGLNTHKKPVSVRTRH